VSSPFPGMDPFIESQAWKDCHHALISVIRDALTRRVVPRYVVRVEERDYLEHQPEDLQGVIESGVVVVEQQGPSVTHSAPMPERKREAFLTVRLRETMDVVSVIEVLSPTNKRPGSDGRQEYLKKREEVLLSAAYAYSLDYHGAVEPPLTEADAVWVKAVLTNVEDT
jgi:Protein of unknown function (DUF4058)